MPAPFSSQIFLTPDALFVLVVDIFAYSDVNSREDALEQWLDILQSRVPGSVVLIVGTHSDCFSSPAMRNERMKSFKQGSSPVIFLTAKVWRASCRISKGIDELHQCL